MGGTDQRDYRGRGRGKSKWSEVTFDESVAPEYRPQDGEIPANNTSRQMQFYKVKKNPFSVNHALEAERNQE
jgi:hypothetical protein